MADMGSLEKMGRELKCPICLSLLKSAVSVTCNHIFCNDCLMESMKSSSSCPVCKVPFRRREIRPSPHMDNLVGILKSMEAATGTNVVSTQVTSAVEVADGSKPADSRKGPKRSKKSAVQKNKIPSKKEANTTKPTVASASRPTKKPSFSTNKRIHVTPFPESETPVRPRKIMKPEEPTNNLNQDAHGKDKALASDKSEGISLSPFFWLREREDEVGGTVETLSEPLSLATPLRHNAPCYSDIKDSEDETPLNMTPNLLELQSKVGVPQIFDSEIFEWTQRPCSPELCSTPSKKQGKCKDILDHIAETHDGEDIQLSCSFDRLDHASNAAQLVNAKEIKQKRKKAQGRNTKKAKLPDHLKVGIKEADANQQDSNSTKRLAAKSCEKNSTTENNTSSRRSKAFNNINLFPCSNYNSSETFLPQDGPETEAHDEQLSKRYQRKGKNSQQKKSARKLGTTGKSTVETTETNYEPSSKRVRKLPNGVNAEKVCCAFCQSVDITEVSGEMVHYHNGKQVPTELSGGANVIHSHKNCTEWAPDVYFEDDSVFNLTAELTRSKRIKCACCGVKGAALGCFDKSCRKSFHFTCAKLIPECRWDNENFVMLCPLHQSSKLPNEISEPQKQSKRIIAPKCPSQVKSSQDCNNNWKWPSGSTQKWVLCCSALSAAEKGVVSEFAKLASLPISTSWSPSVTHVIASTDLSGACKRTLKFLMAILNGKWIVSIDWVKACMDHMEPVDETKFEVTTDVHGVTGGPRLGRQRVIKKQPKLFDGMRFYLHGDYTKSYRGFLQDLVIVAGGTVLHRKPVSRDQQKLLDDSSPVIVVYSLENQENVKFDADQCCRQADDAQALACASGGKAATSAWIIDSVAACNLQPL
ncbi:hypothetical protein ACQ4PT_071484 [Festuca glaucescens]